MLSVMSVHMGSPYDHIIAFCNGLHGIPFPYHRHTSDPLHFCSPFIYWQPGGWPSTERLSSFLFRWKWKNRETSDEPRVTDQPVSTARYTQHGENGPLQVLQTRNVRRKSQTIHSLRIEKFTLHVATSGASKCSLKTWTCHIVFLWLDFVSNEMNSFLSR